MKFLTTLFFLMIFMISGLCAQTTIKIDPKIKLKSKEDRAKVLHYKAIKLYEEGKLNKAKRKLNKAIRMNTTNEYLIDLAMMHEKEGDYTKAFNTLCKIVSNDNGSKISKVKLLANRASYAMYLGFGIEAHSTYGGALRKMNLYGIDSMSIKSDLHNNYGISKLFDQPTYADDTTYNVHKRDIMIAINNIKKALVLNPENCIAQHNLAFVEALLNGIQWELIDRSPRYFRRSDIEHINFPEWNCEIPEPVIEEKIVKYLDKEKEVVFVLDISGSMEAPTADGKSRFQTMKEMVIELIDELDDVVKIGLITLGQDCSAEPLHQISTTDGVSREELKSIVNNLEVAGCTPLNKRLRQAVQLFSNKNKKDKAIFLCSDGINFCGSKNIKNNESTCQVGNEIGRKGIKIHTFSLLLEKAENFQEYAIYDCLARSSGGELLGMTETGFTIKTISMDAPIFSLPLKREDLMKGKYKFPDFEEKKSIATSF